MKFSNKASKYLDKLKRVKAYSYSDKNEVINYLERHDIPMFEKVIEFQIEYSGLVLTISDKPLSTFYARLFSVSDIEANATIDFFQISGQYYFYCGDHETAQFWFVLSQNGELCTCDNERETANVVFSSFDKFIETYAFEDLLKMNKKYEHPPYYDLIDETDFDNLTKGYYQHVTASDSFNQWLSNDDLVIHKGTWLGRSSKYIHFYGDNKLKCETFMQTLKEKNIIA
jgi:hypothetical protein